jgi:hypothetical protein
MPKYVQHEFYCINCGERGIPLSRKVGQIHGKNHRKKLYCPNCRNTVNHIECRNFEEVNKFKENFVNGVYKDEAESSILMCRDTWLG